MSDLLVPNPGFLIPEVIESADFVLKRWIATAQPEDCSYTGTMKNGKVVRKPLQIELHAIRARLEAEPGPEGEVMTKGQSWQQGVKILIGRYGPIPHWAGHGASVPPAEEPEPTAYEQANVGLRKLRISKPAKTEEEKVESPLELVDKDEFASFDEDDAKTIRWVADFIGVNVEMMDAPSPRAWALLMWVRESAENRKSFWTGIAPKVIAKTGDGGEDEQEKMIQDDGRKRLKQLEALEKELVE